MWRDADLANRQLAITYGGNHALDANQADATITAINLANHNPGILTVSQNLSIGSIVPNAHGVGVAGRLPIDIAVGRTATLIGTPAAAADHGFDAVANTYTGLGNVELGGNDGGGNASTLVVQAGNTIRTVTAARNGEGILSFEGADGPAGKIIPHFFNSTIQNGANGTLNVNTSMLIANNVEIGQIDTINIGMVGGNVKALAINASAVGANLLNGTNINFMHANSTLGLFTREHDSTVTFPC